MKPLPHCRRGEIGQRVARTHALAFIDSNGFKTASAPIRPNDFNFDFTLSQ
jgi:hypothetical protein